MKLNRRGWAVEANELVCDGLARYLMAWRLIVRPDFWRLLEVASLDNTCEPVYLLGFHYGFIRISLRIQCYYDCIMNVFGLCSDVIKIVVRCTMNLI